MRHRFIAIALLAVASLAHAQSTYTDPAGAYKLQVPPGWRVEPQSSGVSLLKGSAYASLVKVNGRGAPKGLVEAMARQFVSQWQGFKGSSSGDSRFGGKPGAYGWYTGTDPRGVDAVLKIVGTADGEFGYAMFVSAPRSDFGAFKADLEKIESSFELTSSGNRK